MTRPRSTTSQADELGAILASIKSRVQAVELLAHTPCSGVATGIVSRFAGSVVPIGYLQTNGAAVSRTLYADLFAVIGTTYGAGDGTTTFNLPNITTTPISVIKT
jgi:phage-related tail fiber protein